VPGLVTPLLMVGGAYLCFEGFEKLVHRLVHGAADLSAHAQELQALANPAIDLVALERDKIKGAIRTDFVLSAEIITITITLGTVAAAALGTQLAVLAGVAVLMTVGVHGLVAGIVKIDDLGLWLTRRPGAAAQALGRGLVVAAPGLMKLLSVAGTAAMFLVGGGILVHGLPPLHHLLQAVPGAFSWLAEAGVGIAAGALVLAAVLLAQRVKTRLTG
jgi:hypothetical protein